MRRKSICTAVLVLASALAMAHEFWLMPTRFRYKLNSEMSLEFFSGENFEGEPWDLNRHKIEKMELHSLSGVTDVRKFVKPAEKVRFRLKLEKEGTQMITLQSNYATIDLAAAKFNEYLKEEGLEDTYQLREKTNALDKPSRELYARFVKLLVQVGEKTNDTFKKKSGLRIEIIPLQNPYVLKTGDYLDCQVFFEGKPLPHQLMKVWNTVGNASFQQDIYSENNGTIRFPISAKGSWMVSTVKMIPSEKPGADWQSMWTSLVFGI